MSSSELGPQSRWRAGSADDTPALEQELARIHREMQRRFGDQVGLMRGPLIRDLGPPHIQHRSLHTCNARCSCRPAIFCPDYARL
jgi:hypothetical protein